MPPLRDLAGASYYKYAALTGLGRPSPKSVTIRKNFCSGTYVADNKTRKKNHGQNPAL
ncbi:Uncharacterized protein dnm_072370 [Desulfonema magnum]|uniref:Uncharacterized protein n=1 Tax=Desulfonema magnum TaxID=45655 RepID=A0A975BTE9_9BACT|nr:Uncharacterized protein dnm_072370 [Desulfonema magnum]